VAERDVLDLGELLEQPQLLGDLRDLLRNVRDIPRILGRLQNRLRNPRELGGVKDTLNQLPAIIASLSAFATAPDSTILSVSSRIRDLPALRDLLTRALADELPADVQDGNFVRAGYDAELDRLCSLTSNNKTWLSDLERKEQERSSIRSLKVRFTNNFGYYIEITKATHAGRTYGAMNSRAHGATVGGTKALGGWNESGSFRNCYDRAFPVDALLGAASFNARKPEEYYLPRDDLRKFFSNNTF